MFLRLNDSINKFNAAVDELSGALEETQEQDSAKYAHALEERVFPAMENARRAADELELITDKEEWPLPSYGEMLFLIV
jgi:glutamine synthetase